MKCTKVMDFLKFWLITSCGLFREFFLWGLYTAGLQYHTPPRTVQLSGSSLAKISTIRSLVPISKSSIFVDDTNKRKRCCFGLICFVRGFVCSAFANARQLELSSNSLQRSWGTASATPKIGATSPNKFARGTNSLIYCNNVMYSASVVDMTISVRNLEYRISGQPQNIMANTVLDNTLAGYSKSVLFQDPARSAST